MARKSSVLQCAALSGALVCSALGAGVISVQPAGAAAKRQTVAQVNARLDTACAAFEAVDVPALTDSAASIGPAFKAFARALSAYDAKMVSVVPADSAATNVVKGLRTFVGSLKTESNLIVSLAKSSRTISKAQTLAAGFDEKFSSRGHTIADAMRAVDLVPCASLLLPDDSATSAKRVDLPARNFPLITGFTYVEQDAEREIADALYLATNGFYSQLTVKSLNDTSGKQVAFIAGYLVASPDDSSQVIDSGVKFIGGVEETPINGFRGFYGAQGNFDKALFVRGSLAFELTTDKTPSAALVHQIAGAFIAAQPAP